MERLLLHHLAHPVAGDLSRHCVDAVERIDGRDREDERCQLVAVVAAELFLYPGDKHLFADASTADYDADAAALLMERVRAFLAAL